MYILNLEYLGKNMFFKVYFYHFFVEKLGCFEVDNSIEKLMVKIDHPNLLMKWLLAQVYANLR